MVNTKLQLIYGDGSLGVTGPRFHYSFSYDHDGLDSLVIDHHEWLYRAPKPAFWRATTDNDHGSRFDFKAAQWLGADLFSRCQAIAVAVDGQALKTLPGAPLNNRYTAHEYAQTVTVTYTYLTPTTPQTTMTISYTVTATGQITVRAHFNGQVDLPPLPALGIRLILPTPASAYTYTGLSGETYPDRKAGGKPGTYTVTGLPVTPYLVPQECGMHVETKAVTITRRTTANPNQTVSSPFSLTVKMADAPFAFSCLPYTPAELENATHQEELPQPRRTVLTLFGAVRGVGGIDSWGTDVTAPYRIDAQRDHDFSFLITPEL